ncbi:hypothetical protein F5887DRAFT_997173 [Amanita rubescens]|nr:hypothetical protein F5887DRAFT_997173 [Amanita rubescens]
MPPLQDITHKFLSPLPPSSSPALSYIDEVEEKINPSSAFLALPTSPARQGSNFVFSTPKANTPAPRDSDPFGFLAAERKLKLERGKDHARRQPLAPLEPQRKRQKLETNATPGHSRSSAVKLNQTTTPISKPSAGTRTLLTPPAIAPLHTLKKRRVERTTTTFSFDNDDENNPFLLVSSPSVLSTPSPVKPRPRLRSSPGDDNVENDENVNPFFSPALEEGEEKDVPSVVSSAVVTPIRRRRKRDRMVLEEVQEERVQNVDDSALVDDRRALRSQLPKRKTREEPSAEVSTPVKKKARTTKSTGRKGKEKEEPGKEDGGGKRRSARLSKQSQLADGNKGKKEKASKTTRGVAKGKGKENAGKTSAPTKVKGKGKAKAKDREGEVDETVSLSLIMSPHR